MPLPSDFFPFAFPLAGIVGISDALMFYAAYLAFSTRRSMTNPDHWLLAFWTSAVGILLPVSFAAIAADDLGWARILLGHCHLRDTPTHRWVDPYWWFGVDNIS